jgi:uncharacterized membrane protein
MHNNKEKKTTETTLRSVIKLITFKITEIVISGLIIWIATHDYYFAVGLPLLIEGIQAVAIFFVERGWTHIEWGKECKNCHYYCYHEKRKTEGKTHD